MEGSKQDKEYIAHPGGWSIDTPPPAPPAQTNRLVGSVGLESGGYVFAQRESEEVSDAEKGEISTFIKSLNEGLEN